MGGVSMAAKTNALPSGSLHSQMCESKKLSYYVVISVWVKDSVVQRRKGTGYCYFLRGCHATVNIGTSEGKDERFWNLRNTI